jgi:hypothetical protein
MNVEQARARARIRGQITACPICPAPFTGPTPAQFVVLWDQPPDQQQDSKLRSAFSSLRVDLAESALVTYVGCPDHTRAQLELAQCRWVLTLGATPLKFFRSDLHVTKVHGHPFYAWPGEGTAADGLAIFPWMHPGSVLHDRRVHRRWMAELELFWMLLGTGEGWFDARPQDCWRCGKGWWINGEEGLPYCEEHGREELGRLDALEEEQRVRAQMGEQELLIAGVAPKPLTRNQQDKRRRELALR